jgi:hypothetical protein
MTDHVINTIRTLEDEPRNKKIIAGLKAMIETYFLKHIESTHIDDKHYKCLQTWFDICFPKTDNGQDIEAIINEVKTEMKI